MILDFGCGGGDIPGGYRCNIIGVGYFFYDGKNLPLRDNSFDKILSQQVLEHCFFIEDYYQEAARVLKSKGHMDISFPHRFVPFDSHSRAWFVHWFYPKLYRPDYFNWQTRGYHKRLAEKYFIIQGRAKHITVNCSLYEGPRTLRKIANYLPFIGYFRQVHWRLVK